MTERVVVGADPQLTRAPMLGVTRMLGKYASGFRSFCAPVPAHSKIGTSSRNGSVMDRRTQLDSKPLCYSKLGGRRLSAVRAGIDDLGFGEFALAHGWPPGL